MNDAPDGYRLTGSLAPRVSRLLHSVVYILLFAVRPPQTLYTEAARLAAAGARATRHYPTIRRSPFLSLSYSLPSLSNRDYIE